MAVLSVDAACATCDAAQTDLPTGAWSSYWTWIIILTIGPIAVMMIFSYVPAPLDLVVLSLMGIGVVGYVLWSLKQPSGPSCPDCGRAWQLQP